MQNNISEVLIEYLRRNKQSLVHLNKQITNDTDFAIEYDYEYIIKYLELFNENLSKIKKKINKKLKPKGNILIILSYNEPFIMSIIPILNALLAGNIVTVKPSGKALLFFRNIWIASGIKDKLDLKLELFEKDHCEIENLIPSMDSVYFFGGYENAKKLASKCAESLVEFNPEIEAADCKVIYLKNPTNKEIYTDIEMTIHDSFLHTGQSCQRIQGLFINKQCYAKYKRLLQATINKLVKNKNIEKYIPEDYKPNIFLLQNLKSQLGNVNKIIKSDTASGFPYLIDNPPKNEAFIKSAQFLPTIWISPYETIDDLTISLNSRRYKLGVNIVSHNKTFVNKLIHSTHFSRFTVNSSHTFVRYNEGWGGISPTGYNGYKSWLEHFSYPYAVISD